MSLDMLHIAEHLRKHYNLGDELVCRDLNTPTNDVVQVKTQDGLFALKMYHATSLDEVRWEIDFTLHLIKHGVPVAKPIKGQNDYINTFATNDSQYPTVLFEWAVGEKPRDDCTTYFLIGKAAAQIHQAADTFVSSLPHPCYDANQLIDEQIERMRKPLEESGQLQRVIDLSERLRNAITSPVLDYGICHMDLKPDNTHLDGDHLTVFDFNSSGESWRAIEPYRVLKLSEDYFKSWLEGYRSVRHFSEDDEKAVAAFVVIAKIRDIVWDLGLARSSRGAPLLQANDLLKIVNDWLEWEQKMISRQSRT